MDQRDGSAGCGGCEVGRSRRRFLAQLSAAAAVGFVFGEAGQAFAGLPVSEYVGDQAGGTQHTYPVPAADGVTIDRDNQVILVRFQGKAYAFGLACPHENTALRWRPQDTRFQCPRHESKYTPDGAFVEGRATRNMDRYGIKKSGNDLVVDLSQLFRSDQQQAQWAAAVATL